MIKKLLCWMLGGHEFYWECEENYGIVKNWRLMAKGTCRKCGYKTRMTKVAGK